MKRMERLERWRRYPSVRWEWKAQLKQIQRNLLSHCSRPSSSATTNMNKSFVWKASKRREMSNSNCKEMDKKENNSQTRR